MARIYLHIGTHKTGTTSIQVYLSQIKQNLLDRNILLPDAGKEKGLSHVGHHVLGWSLIGNRGFNSMETWEELQKEISGKALPSVVISSESFCRLEPDKIKQVRQWLQGHEVFIIIYFRAYTSFMKAIYTQLMKDQKADYSFSTFLAKQSGRINYDLLINNWAAEFGLENIIVKVYDEHREKGNLLVDFLHTIGYDLQQPDPRLQAYKNISPTEKETNALRLINRVKIQLPALLPDKVYRGCKDSIRTRGNTYRRLKKVFFLFSKNHFFGRKEKALMDEVIEKSDNQLLKSLLGEMRYRLIH